jgi:hypothetical protein
LIHCGGDLARAAIGGRRFLLSSVVTLELWAKTDGVQLQPLVDFIRSVGGPVASLKHEKFL